MSENWDGWENCYYWYIWRERLSFTGSLTGASWTSAKMNTKPCIVNKHPQMPRDSAASPDGQKIEHVPVYLFGINGYLHICIAKTKLRAWGMCLFPSAQHWRDSTWNATSRFELSQTDKTTWSTGLKESSERPGAWVEVREHKMQGEAEGTEIVQSREEKSSSYSIPLSKQDRMEDELIFRYVQGIRKRHIANMRYSCRLLLWCESPRGNCSERFTNPYPCKFQNVARWGPV